jgi:hypothetical protein
MKYPFLPLNASDFFSSFVMLAVRTEKLLGRPFCCWCERRLDPPRRVTSASHSSLLVLLLVSSPVLRITNRFMERERTLLRAELDLARESESVEWQCRERQPEERCRLKVAPEEVRRVRGCPCCRLVSATTVLLEEPVAFISWCLLLLLFLTWLLLLLLLFPLVTKLSSDVDVDVAVDELGESMA